MKSLLVAAIAALGILFFVAPAQAACLEITRDNTFSQWKNTCNRRVYVNWTDGQSCKNWSCASSIRPGATSPATISRTTRVEWCEWYDGATGKGPCNGGAVASPGPATAVPPTDNRPSASDCAAKRDMLAQLNQAMPRAQDLLRQSEEVIAIYNSNGQRDSTGYAHYHMEQANKWRDAIRRGNLDINRLQQEIARC